MNLNICDVEIEVFDGPAGILVSGGADSALLLYLLAKYTKHKIHVFTIVSSYKGRSNAVPAVRTVNKIMDLTGNFNMDHHFRYIEKQNISELVNFSTSIIDVLYSGETANPPTSILNQFKGKQDENCLARRNPAVRRDTYNEDFGIKFFNPWLNIDKSKIAEIYEKEKILDSLFPVTRSCESLDTVIQAEGKHCGKCWWCEERQWAFNRLV